MFVLRFLLLLVALRPLRSFNIDTCKRWVSPQTSPHFGHRVLQHSDGRQKWILVTSLGPGDTGRMYKCEVQDEIRCKLEDLGENVQKLKKLQPGIALAQSLGQILACFQQKQRERRWVTEELNGLCVLLAADFQQKDLINLTDIIKTRLSESSQQRQRRSKDGVGSIDTDDSSSVASSICHNSAPGLVCKDSTDGRSGIGYKIRNANNNHHHHHIDHAEEEEEDESHLRTEIAIVLDGSGSIDPPDFELAKNFIYDMMKTFYEKCFECVFALVQYGTIIRTEFDLRDGRKDGAALEKVQAVTQVHNVTRTASAIQHVLDFIFNPNYGSQKKAAKIIVVLTDGETFLDNLTLETVINSPRMEGIERYAIGVGEAFNKSKALLELRLIASDPEDRHLFRVTNYSALNVLLSTLQQKIIGIEGTAGDILEFELAQSGFSVHLLDEDYILFGAVGAFDWSGGVLRHDVSSGAMVFLNESKEETDAKNGYLGYSVGSVKTSRGVLIVAGAPRRNMTGTVLVFEGVHLKQRLPGEQIGSYYGSELCTLDIDKDEMTDYLLIGAPFFHIHGEEGKVYLYHLENQTNQFAPAGHLRGLPAFPFAQFGFSMADIGDIDADGFSDVAIGAPLEGHELNLGSSGSVYIFNGGRDGIRTSFSQRITAAQIGPPGLVYFGRSVSGGLDFTEDGLPDLAVGSLGNMTLLRIGAASLIRIIKAPILPILQSQSGLGSPCTYSKVKMKERCSWRPDTFTVSSRPVVRLVPTMHFTPASIFNFHNSSSTAAKLCFDSAFPLDATQPGVRNLLVHYTVDLDVEMEKKRAQFEDHTTATSGVISYAENLCSDLKLRILPCNDNCFSDIVLGLRYWLRDSKDDLSYPTAVLDAYWDPELHFQLPYREDCANKTICEPQLSLTVRTEEELVVGATKELAMDLYLQNSGDNSYMTSLVLEYPTNLHFKNVREVSSLGIECGTSKLNSILFSSLSCKVGHPVFKATTANLSVIWQLNGKRFPSGSANITVSVTNTNRNSTPLIEERSLGVKYAFSAILSRAVQTVYVSAGERSPQRTHFTFNINGRNPFGAQLQLRIWVPVLINNCQLTSIKEATGTQNTTMCKIESVFSPNIKTDLGHADSKNSQSVKSQLVSCNFSSAKEDVTVTADLPLVNSLQVLKNRTNLLVQGEIVFDGRLYVGLNTKNHKTEIKVVLTKKETFDLLPFIIGSSVGGFTVLIIIIFLLYKCGFFKRNYKAMMEEQNDS